MFILIKILVLAKCVAYEVGVVEGSDVAADHINFYPDDYFCVCGWSPKNTSMMLYKRNLGRYLHFAVSYIFICYILV